MLFFVGIFVGSSYTIMYHIEYQYQLATKTCFERAPLAFDPGRRQDGTYGELEARARARHNTQERTESTARVHAHETNGWRLLTHENPCSRAGDRFSDGASISTPRATGSITNLTSEKSSHRVRQPCVLRYPCSLVWTEATTAPSSRLASTPESTTLYCRSRTIPIGKLSG